MRAEEVHVFHVCTGKSKTAEKLKSFSDCKREERKQVYSMPVLLTTTCMCPPVVSIIAHTKHQYSQELKLILKLSDENEDWKTFTQRHFGTNVHTDLSLSYRPTCLRHEYILIQIHTAIQNAAKFRWAKLNILTHDDQIGIHWRQKWNHY